MLFQIRQIYMIVRIDINMLKILKLKQYVYTPQNTTTLSTQPSSCISQLCTE